MREIAQILPDQEVAYLADQGFAPYGERTLEWVRNRSFAITEWLIGEGARLVVVACNSASAAALHELRAAFPETRFVGMEPAVKPAASLTESGVIGVLATTATFQGELYATVLDRHAAGVTVVAQPAPGLAAAVEAGKVDDSATDALVERYVTPMLAAGVDTIALGCTHYTFLVPALRRIVGPEVRLIDPAPAVARQTARLLDAATAGSRLYYTTGDAVRFRRSVEHFVGERARTVGIQLPTTTRSEPIGGT